MFLTTTIKKGVSLICISPFTQLLPAAKSNDVLISLENSIIREVRAFKMTKYQILMTTFASFSNIQEFIQLDLTVNICTYSSFLLICLLLNKLFCFRCLKCQRSTMTMFCV